MGGRRSSLAGRTVLLSGPARGIGREAALQLAARGARLGLAGLEPELLAGLAATMGPRAAWFEADVRDLPALQRAAAGTAERFGGLDAVVANAGIAPLQTFAEMDPDTFEDVIEVNLLGVWRTIRAALPFVMERKGYVLAVASLAATVHLPYMAPYAAAKAGVVAMTDSLRIELRASGVDVGVAFFGFIDTDMTREGLENPVIRETEAKVHRVRPRTLPVRVAGRAIVRAIERRARAVVVPRYGRLTLWSPAVAQRMADGAARAWWRPG